MIVIWGGNRMIDCVSLLSWNAQTVIRLSPNPLSVDLAVPPQIEPRVEIVANDVKGPTPRPKELEVRHSPNAVAILWAEVPILTAQDIGRDEVSGEEMILLHADLRLFGMNVFDDAAGIHIGGALVARTAFSGCSAAISLR